MAKQRLILHVGMPKTGSSSLQRWLDRNRQNFLQNGIDYPEIGNWIGPKHQELVGDLMGAKTSSLERFLNRRIAPTLFLSTEGLTNHLYDYRPVALERFRQVTARIQVHVFMVHRDPRAWIKSQYKQALINPTIPAYGYGTSMVLSDFAELPRNKRLTAIEDLIEDIGAAYGAAQVTASRFEEDWFSDLLECLKLNSEKFDLPTADKANVSISDDMAELIRQLNGLGLDETQRLAMLGFFQMVWKTNHVFLGSYERKFAEANMSNSQLGGIVAQLVPKTNEQNRLVNLLSEHASI